MFQLAVKGKLPLVAVTTGDTVNVSRVLSHCVGETVSEYSPSATKIRHGHVYYYLEGPEGAAPRLLQRGHKALASPTLYRRFQDEGSTLVIVNQVEPDSLAFYAGALPIPHELVMDLLGVAIKTKELDQYATCLRGATIHEIDAILRLTKARDNCVTLGGVLRSRGAVVPSARGVYPIDPDSAHYFLLNEDLRGWLVTDAPFFLRTPVDARLVPRGLLFTGLPGTGKTGAAKYVASELELPLYRLDIGAIKGRYVGESEACLRDALSSIDRNSPCVVLIDEIEKLFSGNDSSGVVNTLLADLLWWLQEHQSRVLTCMTTNDMSALPPEVYRSGRIDRVITFEECEAATAQRLAREILSTYAVKVPFRHVVPFLAEVPLLTPANIAAAIQTVVKSYLLRGVRK